MSPIRPVDDPVPGGGVDSRSNPVNMPQNRYLLLRNWVPRQDGTLQLRDGYTLINTDPANAQGWGYAWAVYWG